MPEVGQSDQIRGWEIGQVPKALEELATRGCGGGIALDDFSSALIISSKVSVAAEKAGKLCPTHRKSGWNCNERRFIRSLGKGNC